MTCTKRKKKKNEKAETPGVRTEVKAAVANRWASNPRCWRNYELIDNYVAPSSMHVSTLLCSFIF